MQNGKKADPDQTAPFGSTVFASLSHFVQNIGIYGTFPKDVVLFRMVNSVYPF